MTTTQTLEKVDDYIRSKFIYSSEAIETIQTPEYMLSGLEINNHLVGDCDDISTFQAALLLCLGFQVRFVAIKSTANDPNYDHVYLEALDHGIWKPYDATVDKDTIYNYHGRFEILI